MNLSRNFTLSELIKSDTAIRKGINNNPANVAMAAAPGARGFVGQNNVNIDPVTKLTAAEEIYLDPTEKVYRKNQRTNTRLT